MKDSKPVKIISTLDKNELKQFELFLQSPYFLRDSVSASYLRLLRLILKSSPSFEGKKINKDFIYSHMFPGEEPIAGKIEKLMTGLFKQLESFLIINEKQKDNKDSMLTLAKIYRERDLESLHYQTIKKLDKEIKLALSEDDEYFYQQILLAEEMELSNERYSTAKSDNTLVSILKNLDNYFLYKKLFHGVSLLACKVNKTVEIEDSLQLIEMSLPLIETKPHLQIPSIQALYFAFRLLYDYQSNNDEFYFKIKEILNNNRQKIEPNLRRSLYTILRIYAIGQSNLDRKGFLPEAFNLFKAHLEEGSLYYQNRIRPATVRTLVKLGLRLSEKEWVFNFLHAHRNRIIGTPYPEEVFKNNLGEYYFYIREFEKALDLLSFSFVNFYYKIGAKRLEIMIYYETGESAILGSKIEALKAFIIRLSKKELPDKSRQANNSFIGILKQILNPKTLNNQERINKLIEKIAAKKKVAEKEWLIEKLKEMR